MRRRDPIPSSSRCTMTPSTPAMSYLLLLRSLRTRRDRNSKRYDIAGVDGVIVQRELEGIGSRLRIYEAHRRAVDGRGQHNLVEGDSGHDQGENRAQAQHELHRFTHDLTSVVLAPSH